MPNKNRLPSLEECFARFLAKQAPGLKHDVERAFRQWNNIVRDHLRSEMALRLTVGDDAQAVPVHIEEDDLPDAFAQVIQDTDEKTWVLLQHRGALRAAAKGTRVLRRDFEKVTAWLAIEPAVAQHDEVRHVGILLYCLLKRLRSLQVIDRLKAINRDFLGAYSFSDVPTVELYGMVIGFVAGLIGVPVEALTVVVTIHELAHAYSDLGRDIDGRRWNTGDFAGADLGIVEGLAQFYTACICNKLEHRFPKVQQAYRGLLALQSEPDRVHEGWLNDHGAGEVVRISMIRDCHKINRTC